MKRFWTGGELVGGPGEEMEKGGMTLAGKLFKLLLCKKKKKEEEEEGGEEEEEDRNEFSGVC